METAPGRVLAVDFGSVRTGVAVSDPRGALASPLVTVESRAAVDQTADRVAALVREEQVTSVVVGWPLTLRGEEGTAARSARTFAEVLAAAVDVPVRLVDERFTTTTAHDRLRRSGRSERRRRPVVDEAAAVVLLQHVLDAARAGNQVGTPVAVEAA